ncbi:MAG TPA: SIMPL domain-containing protein [Solirubrobacterales bacterium]|nr:SIMPL domain-containing protein [Solirubrobacterales bacterium]
MSRRPLFVLAVALLALAVVVALPATASAARTVSVTADATLKVANDSARLSFGVSKERRTRGAALRAAAAKLRAVIAAVQTVPGVGPGDVRTGRITFRKASRGKKTVYRASAGIGVTLHQPDKAGELVSVAIAAGATGVSGPSFFVGDTAAAEASALAAAFQKARARAAVLAAQAGATLGPALQIDEGEGATFEPQFDESAKGVSAPSCGTGSAPVKRANASACTGAPPPTKPGSSTVSATVHVVFELL